MQGAAERARKHVREWESAYKAKHGSAPRYEHYAALATDRTMHGMLAHRAYVEYNKLTDGALEKPLRAAAVSAAARYSSNSSKAPRAGLGWEKGGGGTSDVLKLLVPKVETRNQRPAFSSLANIAERGANPLLALADGYATPAKPEAGKRDALLSSAVAPVSVKLSKRAASLQQLSEVAAAEALAAAARRRKRPSSHKSDAQQGSSSNAAAADQQAPSGAPAQQEAAPDSDDSDYDSGRPLPRRQPRPANSVKLGGGKRKSVQTAEITTAGSAAAPVAASQQQHVPPAVRLQAAAKAAAKARNTTSTATAGSATASGSDRSDREKLLLNSVAVAPLPAVIASVPGMRILDTTSHATARSSGTAAAAVVAVVAAAATRAQRHSEPPQRTVAAAAHSADTRSEWRQRVAETLSRLQEESAGAEQQANAVAAANAAAAGDDVATAGASAVTSAACAAASTAELTAAVTSNTELTDGSALVTDAAARQPRPARAVAAANPASAGASAKATVKNTTADAQAGNSDAAAAASATSKSSTANGSSSSDSRKRQRGSDRSAAAAVGQVSDNFVRMDLKRKGTCKFKKQGGALGGRFSASRGDSNSSSSASGKRGGGKWGSKWGKGDYSKQSNSGSNSEDPVTGEQRNGSAAARDKPLSSGAAKCHGGVDALDQCLDALATAAAAAAAAASSAAAGSSGSTTAANGENEEDVLKRLAPRCPRHQRAAKLLTVRKAGGNRGRKFYGCSLPRGEGCGFFMWAEVSHSWY
jgi:trimeric autotransporter adhesin